MDQEMRVDPEAGVVYGASGTPIGSPNGCGYIKVNVHRNGRATTRGVHCLVWEQVHGPIPDGLEPNHKDGVKSHNWIGNLELLTKGDNQRHAYATGLRGRGGQHPNHKLTEQDIPPIRRLRRSGLSCAEIAARYHVSHETIRAACTGRTWTHVSPED